MRALKVLEDVRIASPCSESWDDMSGTDAVRFCGKCEKNVYNLSAMTRGEAEALVNDSEERCLRFWKRADGTVLTSDCPVGAHRLRLRARIWAKVAGAAASLMLLTRIARADTSIGEKKQPPPKEQPRPCMGAKPAPPKPPESKKKPKELPDKEHVEYMGGEG
jgi:hypothetical protein